MPHTKRSTLLSHISLERRNALFVIGGIIVIIGVLLFLASSSAFRKQETASGCTGCIGTDMDGKTISTSPSAHFTISLLDSLYNKDAITVVPTGFLTEVSGPAAGEGSWTRTFEAQREGDVTLMVSPKKVGEAPYVLGVHIGKAVVAPTEVAPVSPATSATAPAKPSTPSVRTAPSSYVYPQYAYACVILPRDLAYGSEGQDVAALQSFLLSRGYFAHQPTGSFAPLTFAAVQRFQATNGMLANGYVGSQVRALVENLSCGGQRAAYLPPAAMSISLSDVSPKEGIVGMQITVYGQGFTSDNTVYMNGSVAMAHVSSYNGTSLTFVVPQYLSPNCPSGMFCVQYVQQMTPGSYTVSVGNRNGTSNGLPFTVTASNTSNYQGPVTISGLDAPTAVPVGQSASWTVRTLSGNTGETLTYSSVWGDEYVTYPPASSPSYALSTQNSATFSHTYTQRGTYTPTFIVKNAAGQTASVHSTVVVY